MDTGLVLIIISLLIILSYFAHFLSMKIKLPSVLVLLFLGAIFKLLLQNFGITMSNISDIITVIGTVGLVLIVLEAALDIEINRGNILLIIQALGSSFLIISITALAYMFLFHQFFMISLRNAVIFALPLSIISSAIIIPSVSKLNQKNRTFISLEAAFADIIGVLFFNFVSGYDKFNFSSLGFLTLELFLITVFAIISTLFMMFVMQNNNSKIKYFLIVAFLLLFYGIGKYFHLSVLILVLIFGLMLKNINLFTFTRLRKYFDFKKLNDELSYLEILNNEVSFIVRTFFFFVFGMLLDFKGLISSEVIVFGCIILFIQYFVRALALIPFVKTKVLTHILASPRGLVTILLFFSISNKEIFPIYTDIMFFVIATSIIIMTFVILLNKSEKIDEI